MDLQVKLAVDGHAATYASPEIPSLPKWAVWQNQAYGTTYEPVTMVYSKRLMPAAEVPQDHAALLALLNAKPAAYKGKVTAYDPEKSGVGYLFANEDIKNYPQAWDLFRAFGKTSIKLYGNAVRHARGRHLGRAHDRLWDFRLVRARPLPQGPRPGRHPADGLYAGDVPRCLRHRQGHDGRTPPGCFSTICCRSAGRTSSPTRPTSIRCATTSRAK